MTGEARKVVHLPGASINLHSQEDTEEDAVNPNLFDEDFSPAVYEDSLSSTAFPLFHARVMFSFFVPSSRQTAATTQECMLEAATCPLCLCGHSYHARLCVIGLNAVAS